MYILHENGLSYTEIATLFPPVTRQRVFQIVNEERKKLSTPE